MNFLHIAGHFGIFILIVLLIALQLITLDEQITFSLLFNC